VKEATVSSQDEVTVLIAGGGVAALEAALALESLADGRLDVQLLSPEPRFWYRATSVAEPFALGRAESFDIADLAKRAGATFTLGRLVSVDAARRIAYTKPGGAIPYSSLLIACGAVPTPAIDGALTFRGPDDTGSIKALLGEVEAGDVRRVAFAVPLGAVWNLPAYELALMTAAWAADVAADVELAVVTPESEPLQLFGTEASAAVRGLLDERGIAFHARSYAAEARDGELVLVGGDVLPADRVVALPRLQGPRIGGIPQTFEGFVPVDAHGRVPALGGIYAAGDITSFAIKQGGLAAQQADAAAEAIAAAAGIPIEPRPFEPVLRGVLLTGEGPRYLKGELSGPDAGSEIAAEPLWWPATKIVGRFLAPFLGEIARIAPGADGSTPSGVEVDVAVAPDRIVERRDHLVGAAVDEALRARGARKIADVLAGELLVVAPEDTLGEVAERMTELDQGSALVAEYGRLIGILTSGDMLRALAGRVHSSEARVRQWMTVDPIAVTPETTVDAARLLMTEHRVHHLPVVEGERPVGSITLRDVVRRDSTPMNIGLGL
jgi:sulfide:quinone oxidoreductase